MAHFSTLTRANLHTPLHLLLLPSPQQTKQTTILRRTRNVSIRSSSNEDSSYLQMWQKAMDRERKFQTVAENSNNLAADKGDPKELEKKSHEFEKILKVPKEERDRIQRMQVIDRAAAAIAAAQALIKESPALPKKKLSSSENGAIGDQLGGKQDESIFLSKSGTSGQGAPGPDFWSWTPPLDNSTLEDTIDLQMTLKPAPSPKPANPVIEKERSMNILSIPFESTLSETHNPPLPPLQSLMEVGKTDVSESSLEKHETDILFSVNAAEAAEVLHKVGEAFCKGVNPDGSKWWKETGLEQRPDGVICRWTLTRGVSADKSVEWEEKYWEAAGQLNYKELGSEKSGRDTTGNVWREYWKESMWQDIESGLQHMEKSADKCGKNGNGGEWHEKWWEHYNSSGQAEKWAHKLCSIDPNTPLEAGHAHVWHERWGEKYDGKGGSTKYTDKWAERSEGDGWTKWGDKWDENFNEYSQGVKQGETWWQGKYGEQWNRTWGEGHNGSGWIHKYGKSSCGEHWDTHEQQDTWYERYPHFGFQHCFDNSVQLREVNNPPKTP